MVVFCTPARFFFFFFFCESVLFPPPPTGSKQPPAPKRNLYFVNFNCEGWWKTCGPGKLTEAAIFFFVVVVGWMIDPGPVTLPEESLVGSLAVHESNHVYLSASLLLFLLPGCLFSFFFFFFRDSSCVGVKVVKVDHGHGLSDIMRLLLDA